MKPVYAALAPLFVAVVVACSGTTNSDGTTRDAGPIACDTKTCTGNEYCTIASGGPPHDGGGSNTGSSCKMLPAACAATPTCACLMANGGTGCSCSDADGWPSVMCNFP